MRGRQRRWNQGAIVTIIVLGFVHGCSLGPPDSVENICHLFRDRPQWQAAVVRTWTRWGVPPEVTISFVYQESSFRSHARPPREKLLWIIPWKRPSTAYGYAQAIDATWQRYAEAVGDSSADRADFAAATDFIGWYNHQSFTGLGIDKKTPARRISPTMRATMATGFEPTWPNRGCFGLPGKLQLVRTVIAANSASVRCLPGEIVRV